MRWVYYGVALLATVLAAVLWYVVLVVYPASSVPPHRPAPRVVRSLPVAPVLRAVSSAPGVDAQAPGLLCVAGYYAKQTGDRVELLLVDNKPVACSK